jgi:hypothetical protein
MAWTATCEGQRRSWQQPENSEYIAKRLLAQPAMAVMHIARLSRASVADCSAQAAAAEFNGGLMTACHPAGTSGLSVSSRQWREGSAIVAPHRVGGKLCPAYRRVLLQCHSSLLGPSRKWRDVRIESEIRTITDTTDGNKKRLAETIIRKNAGP